MAFAPFAGVLLLRSQESKTRCVQIIRHAGKNSSGSYYWRGFLYVIVLIYMAFDKPENRFVSPYPRAFGQATEQSNHGKQEPQGSGLKREKSRINQVRQDTMTLIWGENDDLPLRILDAVDKSPTASSCIGKVEKFIRGSGFVDKEMEDIVVDEKGTTLLQLHSQLSPYMASLEGFSVNMKYNAEGKPRITNCFLTPTECVRFKKLTEESTDINCFAYNPYFGTMEYMQHQTDEYPFFDPSKVDAELLQYGEKYKGQIYFYGRVRPLYKFYPVPKYWSGQYWIYVDGQIQSFHKNNLSNGFFQSALLNMIGDPNAWSTDPRQMARVKGEDGIERDQPTKTVGEMFNEQMASTFSGVNKAGSVMAMWSLNEQQYVKVSDFPVNTNFDVMSGTFTDAIKGICIATEVDPIFLLAAGNGLANAGDSKKASIEIMQANAKEPQNQLENFYNNILLPNLVKPVKQKVKIQPYSPLTISVPVDKQFWDFMNEDEKIQYIKDNVPTIKINRVATPAVEPVDPNAPIDPNAPPAPTPAKVDENLKTMKISEINKIMSIVKKYEKGQMTLEQAKQFLAGYGLSEEQQTAWLV